MYDFIQLIQYLEYVELKFLKGVSYKHIKEWRSICLAYSVYPLDFAFSIH